MMCYPSIDILVKKVDNKYTLVTLAAMRARELNDGNNSFVNGLEGQKTVSIALEEIYKDKSKHYNR